MQRTPFTIDEFKGVNNRLSPERSVEYDLRNGRAGTFLPEGVNIDVTDDFRVVRRQGFSQVVSGEFHSLWSNEAYSFAVKDSNLVADPLTAATVVRAASNRYISYADTGAGVYLSDGQFIGRYLDGVYEDLARAGTYDPTRKSVDPDEDEIIYDSPLPGNTVVWMFGRLWVATEYGVFYSRAYHPDQFRLNNDYIDEPNATLLAPATDGFYLGTSEYVKFYSGGNPKAPSPVKTVLSAGATEGTQLVTTSDKLGLDGPPMQVAIFETARGKVVGLPGGSIKLLSDANVSYAAGLRGASFLREYNGETHHISSLASGGDSSNMRTTDTAVAEVIRNGISI